MFGVACGEIFTSQWQIPSVLRDNLWVRGAQSSQVSHLWEKPLCVCGSEASVVCVCVRGASWNVTALRVTFDNRQVCVLEAIVKPSFLSLWKMPRGLVVCRGCWMKEACVYMRTAKSGTHSFSVLPQHCVSCPLESRAAVRQRHYMFPNLVPQG